MLARENRLLPPRYSYISISRQALQLGLAGVSMRKYRPVGGDVTKVSSSHCPVVVVPVNVFTSVVGAGDAPR